MSKNNIRNSYLEILQQEQVDVYVYLINGIKLQGKVEYFDDETVMLKNTITQIILNHAISTVVPATPVDLSSIAQA